MRYIAVASPDFVARMLPDGLGAANLAQVPFLVFNRADDAQQQWVRQAMGLRSSAAERLDTCHPARRAT